MQFMKWSPQSPSHTSECAFSKTFHPEYHYCMKSKLPPTEIITINPDTLPSYQPEKEEVTRPISSYIMSCFGDSGAGQFISNGVNLKEGTIQNDPRYVLAAIGNLGIQKDHDEFADKNGKMHKFPCGTYTYDHQSGDYLQKWFPVSESITSPKNFKWIKKKLNL